MVAIRVRVDERPDRRARRDRRDRRQHLAGQRQIPQRVDQQRLPVADDEAGV